MPFDAGGDQEAADEVDMEADVLAPLRERADEAATQLVHLVLGYKSARASLRLAFLRYVRSQSGMLSTSKQLVILRGPPGTGKSVWALDELRMRAGFAESDEEVARLLHVCSVSDFFVTYEGSSEVFAYDPTKVEVARVKNQARVKLAMDIGVDPIYVDNSNMQLWEMAAYVRIAQDTGYQVTIVSPDEICLNWRNVEALLASDDGRRISSALSREQLEELVGTFEDFPPGSDQLSAILSAQRPTRQADESEQAGDSGQACATGEVDEDIPLEVDDSMEVDDDAQGSQWQPQVAKATAYGKGVPATKAVVTKAAAAAKGSPVGKRAPVARDAAVVKGVPAAKGVPVAKVVSPAKGSVGKAVPATKGAPLAKPALVTRPPAVAKASPVTASAEDGAAAIGLQTRAKGDPYSTPEARVASLLLKSFIKK